MRGNKRIRQASAYKRFTVSERAQASPDYRKAKAIEQHSLERALGLASSPVLLGVIATFESES